MHCAHIAVNERVTQQHRQSANDIAAQKCSFTFLDGHSTPERIAAAFFNDDSVLGCTRVALQYVDNL
jgi:hypothetical protein